MYKKLLVFSLLPCICFAKANVEDSKLLGEYLKEKSQDIPLLEDLSLRGDLKLAFITSNQHLSEKVDVSSFSLDGNVYIDYKKVIDGIGFGFEIGTKARSGMIKGGAAIVDTSYLFADSGKLGQFRIGYSKSAGNIFSISYADVMTGYNLVDSGFTPVFFAQPSGSILGTGFDKDDGKSFKFVWLSPTVSGWSMGLSYAPSSRDAHLFKAKYNKYERDYSIAQNFADKTSYIKDSFTAGISYEYGDPEAFNVKVSVAGWLAQGRSSSARIRDVRGYNIGTIFGYGKYKLALGYTDNINSMIPKELSNDVMDSKGHIVGMGPGANNGKVCNIGIGYFGDKWEMSAGYFHAVKKWSNDDRVNSNIATLAVQYNVDKMVSAFVEYNNIRARTCDRVYYSELDKAHGGDGFAFESNKANLFIIGAKIKI